MLKDNIMLLISIKDVQDALKKQLRARRLEQGLTQAGLADRSGVALATLRRFEQTGAVSLESFLKLLMALGMIDGVMEALATQKESFQTIDEVLAKPAKRRKRGWRT